MFAFFQHALNLQNPNNYVFYNVFACRYRRFPRQHWPVRTAAPTYLFIRVMSHAKGFKQGFDRLLVLLPSHLAASSALFLSHVWIGWPRPADPHTSSSSERLRREESGQKQFDALLKKFGMTHSTKRRQK